MSIARAWYTLQVISIKCSLVRHTIFEDWRIHPLMELLQTPFSPSAKDTFATQGADDLVCDYIACPR